MFTLAALEILPGCSSDLSKILKNRYYLFNDRVKVEEERIVLNSEHLCDQFYGETIAIQAIVGKNGSGKSTILDLIYRIMSNVGAAVSWRLVPIKNGNVLPPYVLGVHARLYFTDNDNLCWIECLDRNISVHVNGSDFNLTDKNVTDTNIREVLESLFYTISTNYSIQSLISRDYEDEECIWKEDHNAKRIDAFGNTEHWIDGVFHKNDGYLSPIALNPYRDKGLIDMNNEEDLTTERLVAILLNKGRKGLTLLRDYTFSKVKFIDNIDHIYNKYIAAIKKLDRQSEGGRNLSEKSKETLAKYKQWKDENQFLMEFQDCCMADNYSSVSFSILYAYGLIDQLINGNDLCWWAAAYVVYKTLNIASTYPSYAGFKGLGELWMFAEKTSEEQEKIIPLLVDKILNQDHSHITLKIRQAINFITHDPDKQDEALMLQGFDYDEYLNYTHLQRPEELETLREYLPPAIFKGEVYVKRSDSDKDIPLSQLSSGERQQLYTISTVLYHIENLLSVTEKQRVKYRNMNVIMDEVEITFHPDMQRTFIYNFISLLNEFNVKDKCNICLTIATHSPFVLSDIPQQNVLYLEDGKAKDKDHIQQPFAANVNEILHQSFFMSDGFMGAFAQDKIQKAINLLKSSDQLSTDDEKVIEDLINCIGEPLLKNSLTSLYFRKTNKNTDDQISWYQKQIDRLTESKLHE
jgi:energy-coupling factor transporter ATP-binding protein EcfA2